MNKLKNIIIIFLGIVLITSIGINFKLYNVFYNSQEGKYEKYYNQKVKILKKINPENEFMDEDGVITRIYSSYQVDTVITPLFNEIIKKVKQDSQFQLFLEHKFLKVNKSSRDYFLIRGVFLIGSIRLTEATFDKLNSEKPYFIRLL